MHPTLEKGPFSVSSWHGGKLTLQLFIDCKMVSCNLENTYLCTGLYTGTCGEHLLKHVSRLKFYNLVFRGLAYVYEIYSRILRKTTKHSRVYIYSAHAGGSLARYEGGVAACLSEVH